MITQEDIDLFYKQLKDLKLRFPVAVLSRETGFSKGVVSSYVNKKLQPSENFLNKFNEKFQSSNNNVSIEEQAKKPDTTQELLQVMIGLMKTQNLILERR